MMQVDCCTPGDGDGGEKLASLFGPGHVDQSVRQALQVCWMALPKDRKNAEELERQFRRIVERALRDFREDSAAFGRSG